MIHFAATALVLVGLSQPNFWLLFASVLALTASGVVKSRSTVVFVAGWLALIGCLVHGVVWGPRWELYLCVGVVFASWQSQGLRIGVEFLSAIILCFSPIGGVVVPCWIALRGWTLLKGSARWLLIPIQLAFVVGHGAVKAAETEVAPLPEVGFVPELNILEPDRTDDDAVVARVFLPEVLTPPEVLYLRAAGLDAFDGVRWTARSSAGQFVPGTGGLPLRVHVEQDLPMLLTVGRLAAIRSFPAKPDGQGGFRASVPAGTSYWLQVVDPLLGPNDKVQSAHSVVPALDPEVRKWWLEHRPWGQVRDRMERWSLLLQAQASYVRYPPDPQGDPLADLLFLSKQGDCERFASALALLARADGIPSRVVIGYASKRKEGNEFVVRASDAHAWVEVYVEGEGWIPFDATPGTRPSLAGSGQGEGLSFIWFAVPLVGVGVSLWLLRRRRADPWLAAVRLLRAKGWILPEDVPPLSQAHWLAQQVGEPATALIELAWAVYRVEYRGDAGFDAEPYLSALSRVPSVDEVR